MSSLSAHAAVVGVMLLCLPLLIGGRAAAPAYAAQAVLLALALAVSVHTALGYGLAFVTLGAKLGAAWALRSLMPSQMRPVSASMALVAATMGAALLAARTGQDLVPVLATVLLGLFLLIRDDRGRQVMGVLTIETAFASAALAVASQAASLLVATACLACALAWLSRHWPIEAV